MRSHNMEMRQGRAHNAPSNILAVCARVVNHFSARAQDFPFFYAVLCCFQPHLLYPHARQITQPPSCSNLEPHSGHGVPARADVPSMISQPSVSGSFSIGGITALCRRSASSCALILATFSNTFPMASGQESTLMFGSSRAGALWKGSGCL